MQVTIFWSHPYHGSGSYQVDALSATSAGQEAAESLAEDFAEDDQDSHELALIRDDLDICVWNGAYTVRPATAPDFIFT